jgi:hypothetical protein
VCVLPGKTLHSLVARDNVTNKKGYFLSRLIPRDLCTPCDFIQKCLLLFSSNTIMRESQWQQQCSNCYKTDLEKERSMSQKIRQYFVRDRRLQPRLYWINLSSGLLREVGWFRTDVSEIPICPIFKDQAVFLDSLTLEYGSYMYSRNVCSKPTYAT